MVLIALDAVHHTGCMPCHRQCRSQCGYRVAFTTESHFKGFGLVDLYHEVAAARLGLHLQLCALESQGHRCSWIRETIAVGIGGYYASHILDMAIIRFY